MDRGSLEEGKTGEVDSYEVRSYPTWGRREKGLEEQDTGETLLGKA